MLLQTGQGGGLCGTRPRRACHTWQGWVEGGRGRGGNCRALRALRHKRQWRRAHHSPDRLTIRLFGCTHRKCAHATASQPVSMTNRRVLRRVTTRMRTCIGAWHRGAGLGSRTASLGWRIGTAHWADYLGIARSAQSQTREGGVRVQMAHR